METKISKIYNFLQENRNPNIELQKKFRESNLVPFKSKTDKVYSLLHSTFNTQSQVKLDRAMPFFKDLARNPNVLESFESFNKYLGEYNPDKPYLSLYNGLEVKPGWGQKTSALLVKNVFQIHHTKEMKHLKFWKDVPKLKGDDKLKLPVDAVIKEIFKYIDPTRKSFNKINNYFETTEFNNQDIWDDLWFWGFLTQRSEKGKKDRKIEFNEGKYWALIHIPKGEKEFKEIKKNCKRFIKLLLAK